MSLEIIPMDRWDNFLESFISIHGTNLFNIEKLKMRNKNILIANDLKLRAIDIKRNEFDVSTIIIGDKLGTELSHLIKEVKNITLERDINGEDKALYINSSEDNIVVSIHNEII